jgi:hypothetical protein
MTKRVIHAAVLLFCAALTAGAVKKAADGPQTTITGKKMTLLTKGRLVGFVGDVKMTRGDDFMSADRMVTDEQNNTSHAWNKVYYRRDDPVTRVRWEIWGDEALYDTGFSSGTLWGTGKRPVRVKRTMLPPAAKDETLWLQADKIVMFDAQSATASAAAASASTATAAVSPSTSSTCVNVYGRVYARYKGGADAGQTEVWSEKGFYNGPEGKLEFTGGYPWKKARADVPIPQLTDAEKPVARQENAKGERRHMKGESISYSAATGRWAIKRNVFATILRLGGLE